MLALTGCGDDGAPAGDAGFDAGVDGGADSDAGIDGGEPPGLEQLRYTPEGCGFEVATPEVRSAARGPEAPGGDDFGGAPTPDHVHVGFAGAAATGFNVNWRTDTETLASQILFGEDEAAVTGADGAAAGVMVANGHTMLLDVVIEDILEPDGLLRLHEVHVCGLIPSTRYFYKVGGPGHWSEIYSVATAPAGGTTEPWSFVIAGDSRNNIDNNWPIAMREVHALAPDLQVFSGDAVGLGLLQPDWDMFFESTVDDFAIQDLMGAVPFMPSNGNHESLSTNFVAQFAMPQEVSADERAEGEEWYSFDFGNAHFVVLNDTVVNESVLAGSEAAWLRADLAAVDRSVTPWVFAVHHRPLYTCSTHDPREDLRQAWQPIYDEFEVDIVFNGHNHLYERTKPIRGLDAGQAILAEETEDHLPVYAEPGAGSGAPSGTLYMVSGAVGAPLYGTGEGCDERALATSVPNFAHFEVEGRSMHVTVYNPLEPSTPIESFTLAK